MLHNDKRVFRTSVPPKIEFYTTNKSLQLLEGAIASLIYGKSEDLADLKEYQLGDEVKDIDWKATARAQETIMRRYNSIRKQPIDIVLDNSLEFFAQANRLEQKIEVALYTAGTLAFISTKLGNPVSLTYKNPYDGVMVKTSRTDNFSVINSYLNTVNGDMGTIRGDDNFLFKYGNLQQPIMNNYITYGKLAPIVVIISDYMNIEKEYEGLYRLPQNVETYWIDISDLPIANDDKTHFYEDILTGSSYPDFLRTDETIITEYESFLKTQKDYYSTLLLKTHTKTVSIENVNNIPNELINLLTRRRRQHERY